MKIKMNRKDPALTGKMVDKLNRKDRALDDKLNRKDRKLTGKMTNSVEPAAKTSAWGKGCAGKGGKTLNSKITDPENKQVKESE